jgi:hypothetical protein
MEKKKKKKTSLSDHAEKKKPKRNFKPPIRGIEPRATLVLFPFKEL